jgi:hypothetical protein
MKGIDFKKQLAINTANTLKNNKLISSENIKNNLIILPELKQFIPPLNTDEFSSLEESITANGCRTPLLVWDTIQGVINPQSDAPNDSAFVLFDGHHRYEICKKNAIDYQIDLMSFPTIEEVKDFMIDFQVGRRNMTAEQISYLRGVKYQRLKSKQGGVRTGKSAEEGLVDTASKLAEEFNVSPATIKRDAVFAEGLDKMGTEFKTQVLNGQTKIDKKTIQKLAKSDIENPITSIDELKRVLENPQDSVNASEKIGVSRRELLMQVNRSLKNASNSDLIVEIKGSFIINNGLESVWRELRELSEDVIIDENFTDRVSIFQTVTLGIVREL